MKSEVKQTENIFYASKIKEVVKNIDNYLLILIMAMHLWALFAFQVSVLRDIFLPLTSVNMIVCATLVFRSYKGSPVKIFLMFITICLIGFSVEMLGVNTGFPFGHYSYSSVLGPQVMGTPVIIGLNWFILFSGIVYMLELVKMPILAKALAGAVIITAIDILIEPVAIYYGFWEWKEIHPPLENYLGWFTVGFIMFMVYFVFFNSLKVNRKAFWVVLIFVLFFIIQKLFI